MIFIGSTLALWNITKKKPLATARHPSDHSPSCPTEHWITAIATLPYTDLIASGNNNLLYMTRVPVVRQYFDFGVYNLCKPQPKLYTQQSIACYQYSKTLCNLLYQ